MDQFRLDRNHLQHVILFLFLSNLKVPEVHRRLVQVYKTEARSGFWTVLAHPPYSPDLAPTDYHSVPDMQRFLEGTVFKTKSGFENWLVSYFASKKPEFWKTGTMSLQNRWQTVVDKEVTYY
uniref:Mos1 transposase HTH domain-containing protein n=1 Tax=Caenorhabditis japonica TaxID=281687 RepID=A0A8R1IG05_CAEJA